MRQFIRLIISVLLIFLVKIRLAVVIAWGISFFGIVTLASEDRKRQRPTSGENRDAILIFGSEQFRGDGEALAGEGTFRVLTLHSRWAYWLRGLLSESKSLSPSEYVTSEKGTEAYSQRQKFLLLLQPIVASLIKIHKIKAIVTANVRYKDEYDWGQASKSAGIAYITFYREGMASINRDGHFYKNVKKRLIKFRRFTGHHIIVQGPIVKEVMLDANFVPEDKISVLGALRMVAFAKRVDSYKHKKTSKRTVTLFPTTQSKAAKQFGRKNGKILFNDIHLEFVKLAQELTDVDFIIKPKPKHNHPESEWRKDFNELLNKHAIDISLIKNLTINPYLNAQDLVFSSDVICGLDSTTHLEAAYAGKPVVIACYERFNTSEEARYFFLRGYEDAFDMAIDGDNFKELIRKRLNDPHITDKAMALRKELFAEKVADLSQNIIKNYVDCIGAVISEVEQNTKAHL